MSKDVDPEFYDRADAVINLANEQVDQIGAGKVGASLSFAATRFNVWAFALRCENGPELETNRSETIEYFVKQYRAMLEENIDDYIKNFAK